MFINPRGEVIKLHVGEIPIRFTVHEELIISTSTFFRKALNGAWKEADERCVKLPKDDPGLVQMYLHWVYSSKIAIDKDSYDEDMALARLYVLEDKLQDDRFKDAISDALTFQNENVAAVTPEAVHYIYENTLAGSKIRALVVDTFLSDTWTSKGLVNWIDYAGLKIYPEGFVKDLASAALRSSTDDLERTLEVLRGNVRKLQPLDNLCLYHHHEPADDCPWEEPKHPILLSGETLL